MYRCWPKGNRITRLITSMESNFLIVLENRAVLGLFADKFNNFLDVAESCIECLTLRVATRQERTLNNVHVIFVSLDNDGQQLSHVFSLPNLVSKINFHPWRAQTVI